MLFSLCDSLSLWLYITIKTIELSHPRWLCSSFLGFKKMFHHFLLLELLHGLKNDSQISSVMVHMENEPCPTDSTVKQSLE